MNRTFKVDDPSANDSTRLSHIETLAALLFFFGRAARTALHEANIIENTGTAALSTEVSPDCEIGDFFYGVILQPHCVRVRA